VVSWNEVGDALADLFDDACSLVPEDDRERGRMDALDDMKIGVADTTRRHANEHLARLGRVELDVLDNERGFELVEDGGADGAGSVIQRVGEPTRAGLARSLGPFAHAPPSYP
jgi:hypothetical protein